MECCLFFWDVKAWTAPMVQTMHYQEILKQRQKNGRQGNITEIPDWIFTLLSQIFNGQFL